MLHIISKKQARDIGMSRYYTGKPCPKDHICERYTGCGHCVLCVKEASATYLPSKKERWRKNSAAINKRRREMYHATRAEKNERQRQYMATHIKKPHVRAERFMRGSLKRIMINVSSRKPEKDCGYTKSDLVRHLEGMFLPEMSWENYGEWHIDHIVPIKHFIDNGIYNQKIINSLRNLEPIWGVDNMSKGAAITERGKRLFSELTGDAQ